jgi:hypothetical protein
MLADLIGCCLPSTPRRHAMLLVGGDKTGNTRWYDEFVPVADRLFDEHLAALKREERNDG